MGIGVLVENFGVPKVYVHIIDTETLQEVAVKSLNFNTGHAAIAFRNLEYRCYTIAVTHPKNPNFNHSLSSVTLGVFDKSAISDIISASRLAD